jgi:hypothetical protein
MRPVIAKSKPAWEDIEVFKKYMDACAKECKNNKTSIYTIHVYVAQKPE